jgi:hypothetical protein
LKSKGSTPQRDPDGLPRWDPNPDTFQVIRSQEFGGAYNEVSPFMDKATLVEMKDSGDPVVREQFFRIRRQTLRLAEVDMFLKSLL